MLLNSALEAIAVGPELAERLAEQDVVIVGAGHGGVISHGSGWEAIEMVSAMEVNCKPCACDYYDWDHEEANIPVPKTLPGFHDGTWRYPGKAPKHMVSDRVSFWPSS